jgi:hypothetical protein
MGPHDRHVTHNKCYATCGQFAGATLDFLRDKVPMGERYRGRSKNRQYAWVRRAAVEASRVAGSTC